MQHTCRLIQRSWPKEYKKIQNYKKAQISIFFKFENIYNDLLPTPSITLGSLVCNIQFIFVNIYYYINIFNMNNLYE